MQYSSVCSIDMLAAFLLLYVLAAAVKFSGAYPNLAPAPITVFYETLCPDSIRFINKKLVPAYSQRNFNFEGLLSNLTLVPFGHVKVIDASRYQYSCQHGQAECEGNKLHGCAVKYFTDKRNLLEYISCLLYTSDVKRNSNLPYPVNECRDKIPAHILPKISNCYNTNEGWDIFNQHGSMTESVLGRTKYFIPYITFYNVKDDKISDSANGDFRNTLCSMYGLRDEACTDYNARY